MLMTGLPSSTADAASPWEWIPEKASAVVRLQAPDTTIQELSRFVDAVQPGFGPIVQTQTSPLGLVISNPTLDGVDMSRDWFAAAFAKTDGQPDLLFLIPTTDAIAMEKAIGTDFSVAKQDGWLVYSKSPELINLVENCLKGDADHIMSLFDSQISDELISGQLTGFVNVASLKETFADQLGNAETQLDSVIDTITEQVAATNPEMNLESVWKMYRAMGRGLLQGVRDSNSVAVAVHIADNDIRIEKLITFANDSASSRFIATQPAASMDLLKSVPEGQSGYAGMQVNPQELADWLKAITSDLIEDPAVSERFQSAMEAMIEARIGTFAGGGGIAPSEPTALKYFGLMEVGSVETLKTAFDAFAPGLEYDIGGIHQAISIELHAETIDGVPVDILQTKQDIKPSLDPLGIQQAVNDRLYGPDGITQRLVYQQNILLQTLGGGTESMRQLMKGDTWTDTNLLSARQQLSEKANLVILADMPAFVRDIAQLVVASGKLPLTVDEEQLAAVELSRSYSGVSIATETNRVHFRAVIPAKTLQGFVQLGLFVQQSFQGGR